MDSESAQEERVLAESLERALATWEIPELSHLVTLRVSSRFRSSLGSFRPERAEITVASWLLGASASLRDEVICHEAAHAAVHFVHGLGARPHGPEWRDFMTQAGFEPRVRVPFKELPESRQKLIAQSRSWEHRCPVCQATRLARTRVTRWRCSRCRSAGRSGELVIERVPSPIAVDA